MFHDKMHILLESPVHKHIPPSKRRRITTTGRRRGHTHYNLIVTCCLILPLLQANLASALSHLLQQAQQQQQQQPMIVNNGPQQATGLQMTPDNGAIMQALSQFAAQQMASGSLPGGASLQLTATPTASGGISIGNNNQQVALVSGSNAANGNNQTGGPSLVAMSVPSSSPGQQQQQQQQQQQPGAGNQFVIKFHHNDSKNQLAYVSITPVNYTNLHEPRIELRYQSKYPYATLSESAPNNTVVAAVIVNDEDSGLNGETSLAIEQGNELNHFKLVSTGHTNTIQVNGAPLSRHLKSDYNLTIVARDHGSPPKASSSTLVIKLHPSPNGGQNLPMPHHSQLHHQYPSPIEPMPSSKPPVTDLMYVGTMLVVMFSAIIILIIIGCGFWVQRPTQKANKAHKGAPPTRTTSATNSRIVSPTDQCSAYCLTSGYDLSNLNIN